MTAMGPSIFCGTCTNRPSFGSKVSGRGSYAPRSANAKHPARAFQTFVRSHRSQTYNAHAKSPLRHMSIDIAAQAPQSP